MGVYNPYIVPQNQSWNTIHGTLHQKTQHQKQNKTKPRSKKNTKIPENTKIKREIEPHIAQRNLTLKAKPQITNKFKKKKNLSQLGEGGMW